MKDFNLIYVASGCRLFFWEYASNNPWFSYDGIDKEIQFVDCVKLKPGIFDVAIVHALVVVTATDVLLLSIHSTHDAMQPSVVSMNTIVPIQGFSVMDLWPCPSWLLRRQSPRVPLRTSRCSFSLSSRPDLLPPLFRRPALRHPASPLSLAPERLLAAESLLRRHPPLPLRSPLRRFPHPLLARRRRFALVPLLTQRPRSSRSTVFKTSSSPLCRVSLPPRVAGSSRTADCRDRPPSWSSAACGFSRATSLRNRWSAR